MKNGLKFTVLFIFAMFFTSSLVAGSLDSLRENFKKSWTKKTNSFNIDDTIDKMKSCGKDYEDYLKSFGGLSDDFDKLKDDVKGEAIGFLTGGIASEVGSLLGGNGTGTFIETPYLANVSSICYEKGGAIAEPTFGVNFDVCSALDDFNLCNCLPDLSFLGLKKRTNPPLKDYTSLKSLCNKAKNALKEKDIFGKELAVKFCFPKNSPRCQKILSQKPKPNAIKTTDILANADIKSAGTPDRYKYAEPMSSENEKRFDILVTDNTDLDVDSIVKGDAKISPVIIDAWNSDDTKTIESVKTIKKILRNSEHTEDEVNYNDVSVPYENIESYKNSIIDAVHGTESKIGELEDFYLNDPYERAVASKLQVQQLVEETDFNKANSKVAVLVEKYRKDLIRFTKDRIERERILTQNPDTDIPFPVKQSFEGIGTKEKLHRFYDINRQKLAEIELHLKYENNTRRKVNIFKILLEAYVQEAVFKKPSTAYMEVEKELASKTQGDKK